MKRIRRLSLSPSATRFLRRRSDKVAGHADPRNKASRLWRLQANSTFREIREILAQMAHGLERCMYCEDSEGTAIDHFWPKALYPLLAFTWDNYFLACSRCNSNFKRELFPLDDGGEPLLIDPCEDEPLDHLSFSPSTGRYEPITPKGQPSIEVFGLNRSTLTMGRANAWVALQQLLVRYAHSADSGERDLAGKIEKAVREYPFAGVLAALLRIAAGPAADDLVHGECLAVLRRHQHIGSWV